MRRLPFLLLLLFALSFSSLAVEDETGDGNLLPNGDFDKDPDKLVHWDPLPADRSVSWVDFNVDRGKILVFTLTKGVAEGTGLLFYSDFIPIKEGKKYRFSVDYKSFGPEPKPFVKGYGLFPDIKGKVDRRELYKKKLTEKSPSTEWKTLSTVFTLQNPVHKGKYEIKWAKVMLYAYLRPGQIYFDNVRIEEVEKSE